MNVKNIINANGNSVPNQFIIEDNNRNISVFQSYKSEICEYNWIEKELKLFGNMWDYSATTRKYFKQFINENTSFVYENKAQWIKEIASNDSIKVV